MAVPLPTLLYLIDYLIYRVKSTGAGWTKLKLQSALPASVTATGKYSPAVGKYQSLDKTWKPVQKIKSDIKTCRT